MIISGLDTNSFPHIENKKKNILIQGKGSTQGLEHTLAAEKLCSIKFTEKNTKFCLRLHYNGANSYLFVNDTEFIKFKTKYSKIAAYSLCLGNVSKDNMKYEVIK